jgi:hypothetical protein
MSNGIYEYIFFICKCFWVHVNRCTIIRFSTYKAENKKNTTLSDEIVPKSNRKKETTSIFLTHTYMSANFSGGVKRVLRTR